VISPRRDGNLAHSDMEFGDGCILVGSEWADFVGAALRWAKIASRSTFSSRMVSKFARTSLVPVCAEATPRQRGHRLRSDPDPRFSISHVLSLEDQLAVWKTCHDNLRPDGRLLVEITMPNMASFADSFSVPSRTPVEIDIDNVNESDGTRLIRRKTTRYLSHEQRAQIRFMYEKYQDGRGVESYIDDFACQVFFPRELRLLFIHTGYEVEETLGDYRGRALMADSPVMIMIGRRSS
jgi:hypothetical protein